MSILTAASQLSAWRGYEYWQEKRVLRCTKTGEGEYEGLVSGSAPQPYLVKLRLDHPRTSTCTCPHAAGRRVVCKHMVALYFTAFPQQAQEYAAWIEESEREEEERARELYRQVEKYVYSLSKEELRQMLIRYILEMEQCGGYW